MINPIPCGTSGLIKALRLRGSRFDSRGGVAQKHHVFATAAEETGGMLKTQGNALATVVTAYYPTRSKKRSVKTYMAYIKAFMTNIPCNVHIYTTAKIAPLIMAMREGLPALSTRVDIRELGSLYWAQHMDLWLKQHKHDPERNVHVPEMYVVWHEKIKFVLAAIAARAFPETKYYIWCDIGCFRNGSAAYMQKFKTFPSHSRLRGSDESKVHVLRVNAIPAKELASLSVLPRKVRLGAGIIYSGVAGWRAYDKAYETLISYRR